MSLSYRDDTMQNCVPDLEHPFSREEYQGQLSRIRECMADENIDRVFEPGMVVNYENQFFLPRQIGLFFMTETMAFFDDEARLMSTVPYGLTVVE